MLQEDVSWAIYFSELKNHQRNTEVSVLGSFKQEEKNILKKSQKSEQITFLWGQQSRMVTIWGSGQVSFVIVKI